MGLVSIAADVVTFVWPGLTALALVYIIPAWAVVTGVLEIVVAVRLRRQIDNEWWLVLGGVLSIGFGVLLMVASGVGALALVFWSGAYAIVFGALLVGLAFRLRNARPRACLPAASAPRRVAAIRDRALKLGVGTAEHAGSTTCVQ